MSTMSSLRVVDGEPSSAATAKSGPRAGPLRDRFGRVVRYMRLSVTDRCDLRCIYCMPEAGAPMSPRPEVLTVEETIRVVAVFRRLGVETVRLTGGEPLARRGVLDIVRGIRGLGVEDIALSTNATMLSDHARALRDAGVRRVNISLDTLRPERLRVVSRRGDLARILAGIDAGAEVGFEERKLNTVVMRGFNDDELAALVEHAWARGYTPRFIELMPVGEGARLIAEGRLVPTEEIKARVQHLVDTEAAAIRPQGRGPARYLPARDGVRRIGFISAMSHNFCDGCNRVRLSAKGELRPCLASPRGVSLRDRMRAGETDDVIAAAVRAALDGKEATHHFLDSARDDHLHVGMSQTGG
jgi:cyclic pyranopterin phosphate synthase